jgi:6-pyruvoyltetrahydropterin/6-carboxytetrahydropterin synthase
MQSLTRTVRLTIHPDRDGPASRGGPGHNPFAGSPAMIGLGRHSEFHVRCRGEPDPATGYLIDIKVIDHAVRNAAASRLAASVRDTPHTDPLRGLSHITRDLADRLGPIFDSLRWSLSPYLSLDMHAADPTRVILRQQFDFSASHRLHVPTLADARNRELFGKCNNPTGHGHNYRLAPAIASESDGTASLHAVTLWETDRTSSTYPA